MDIKATFTIMGWILFDIFFLIATSLYFVLTSTFIIRKRLPTIVVVTSVMIGSSTNFDFYQLLMGLSSSPATKNSYITIITLIFKITQSSAVLLLILRSIHLNMKYYSHKQSNSGFIDLKSYVRLRNSRIYVTLGTIYIVFLFVFFIALFLLLPEKNFKSLQYHYFLIQRAILTVVMLIVMLTSLSIKDKLGIKVELFGLSIIWTLFIMVFIVLNLLNRIPSIQFTLNKQYDVIYRLFKIFLSNIATLCIILVYPIWISQRTQIKQNKKQLKLQKHRNSSLEDYINLVNMILISEEKLVVFKKAAQKLFSIELVLFCLEVIKYNENDKRTKEDAMNIYIKYVKDGAADEINIKYTTKKAVEEQLGLHTYYGTIIRRGKKKLSTRVKVSDNMMSDLKGERGVLKHLFDNPYNECVKLLADNVLRTYLEIIDESQ